MALGPEELLVLALQIGPVVRELSRDGDFVLHVLDAGVRALVDGGLLQDWAQFLGIEDWEEEGQDKDQLHHDAC